MTVLIYNQESLIKGLCDNFANLSNGKSVRLNDILSEHIEKSALLNQYEILSSTVNGIYAQREYFSKDIASANNIGYNIIKLHDIVLSPQNLWMGNINYNDKFDCGIVSPSYKVYNIKETFNKRFIACLLKTHRALYNYMLVSEQGASIVRRNLNIESFGELTFSIPDIHIQKRYGLIMSELLQRLEISKNIHFDFERQKYYLLQQMFI